MAASLETISSAAMRWPFRLWAFGEGIALEGLLAAASELDRADIRQHVSALCLASIGRGVGSSPDDHPAPAGVFLSLYRETGDERFLQAVRSLVALHERMPVNPAGALLVRAHQPGWRHQIWVDSMDVIGPLMAGYAAASGEEPFHERAISLTLAHARLLQSDSGLFFHGYETHAGQNGHFWARGNGWALLGMVETLALTPRETAGWHELSSRLELLLGALARTQRPSGLWCTVVDRDESYEETTLAAMAVAAIARCADAGLIDGGAHQALALCARAAVLAHVGDDGVLSLVSEATPVGQFSTYATRPFGSFPWGQGPLLLMLCNHQGGSVESRAR